MTIDEEALHNVIIHHNNSIEENNPGNRRSISVGAAPPVGPAAVGTSSAENHNTESNGQQQQQQGTSNNNRRSSTQIPSSAAATSKPVIESSPMSGSFRLPLKKTDLMPSKKTDTQKATTPPNLLHPILHEIPMHVRFGISGFLSNVLFMIAYNYSVVKFEGMATSSTIYAIVYLIFIPVTHGCISLLVFGWPEKYLPSLMSNAPVGLTAIMIGAGLTAYLDKMEFNNYVVDMMESNWKYLGYNHVEETGPKTTADQENQGEFYSSLLVLIITGIWTFILSVFINSPSEQSDKKEQ